jgi:hypothetical protein
MGAVLSVCGTKWKCLVFSNFKVEKKLRKKYQVILPRFMNGMVKSTALSRSDVMVKSVMAKSAL